MSYSFNVRGSSEGEVVLAAALEMDKVIEQQPSHALDAHMALCNLENGLGLVIVAPDNDITVSMHGAIVTDTDPESGEASNVLCVTTGFTISVRPRA